MTAAKKPAEPVAPILQESHWPDGTRRSQGNAFTDHNFRRGEAKPSEGVRIKQGPPSSMAFGAPHGRVPGMGRHARE